MRLVAIVGSASNAGKTALACAVLRAIPGLGAVKISPREGPARVERGPGERGKDTARYVESGAAAVARIVAPRERVRAAWEAARADFASLPGVVVEGAGALALAEERFTVFVAAPESLGARPERDERLAAAADAIVVAAAGAVGADLLARHRARVPVHVVDPDAGGWADPSLLAALRSFLGLPSPSQGEGPGRELTRPSLDIRRGRCGS